MLDLVSDKPPRRESLAHWDSPSEIRPISELLEPMMSLPDAALLQEAVSAPTLVVFEASDPGLVGRRFTLTERQFLVGRQPGSSLVVANERGVSRRHAVFFVRGQSCMCVDEGSTNGTYVNQRKLERELALMSGDRIRIGSVVLVFLAPR